MKRRSGLTLFQLLVALAILAILLGLLLPAIQKVREAAQRMEASNDLKQIGLAFHNYADTWNAFPPGDDANHFSVHARFLPFIEQDALYKRLDLTKGVEDKANAAVAGTVINVYVSPRDPIPAVQKEWGATNYVFNHHLCYRDSKSRFGSVTDGTSNTILSGETLKGDGGTKGMDVRRQYVRLKEADLKGLTEDAGVKPFKTDTNIAGDRCARWIDGRFLQTTFNGRLHPNDARPDVSCGGAGGVAAPRSLDKIVLVGMVDGSVRSVSVSVTARTWQAAMTPAGGEVLGPDF